MEAGTRVVALPVIRAVAVATAIPVHRAAAAHAVVAVTLPLHRAAVEATQAAVAPQANAVKPPPAPKTPAGTGDGRSSLSSQFSVSQEPADSADLETFFVPRDRGVDCRLFSRLST